MTFNKLDFVLHIVRIYEILQSWKIVTIILTALKDHERMRQLKNIQAVTGIDSH